MPIYDYACRQCGHHFEYLLLSKSPPAKCPACGTDDLEQLISPCAVTSETTRQFNIKQERKRAVGETKEKVREHEKYVEAHEHHDH